MARRTTFVCWECRRTTRTALYERSEGRPPRCPSCRGEMIGLSDKTDVPPSDDVKAWKTLREFREVRPAQNQVDLAAKRVARIHELERRIEELRGRPEDKDRRRLIGEVEEQMEKIRALLEKHRA